MSNDPHEKFVKMKRFIDKINELEKKRTVLKRELREKLSDPLISINSVIEYAVDYQKEIGRVSTRIQNLHGLYNRHWFTLTYEGKVRYRYWVNGKPFPNDIADQKQKPKDQNVTSNKQKSACRYFKIDRPNARKLCSKLIEFLSGQDEYFKVGFDENHTC